MMFIQTCKEVLRDLCTWPADRAERCILALLGGVPVLVYPFVLFSKDDQGNREFPVDTIGGHLGLFIGIVAVCLACYTTAILLVATSVLGRKLAVVHYLLGAVGICAGFHQLRNVRRVLRTVEAVPLTLEHVEHVVFATANLDQALGHVPAEPQHTLAAWISNRCRRNAALVLQRHRDWINTDPAYDAAVAVVRRSYESTWQFQQFGLEPELVYFSVSGAVNDPAMWALIARHQINGVHPTTVEVFGAGQRLVSRNYQYAVVLCAPKWVSRAFHTMSIHGDALLAVGVGADARGTYTDTVARLWDPDYRSMYFQMDRVVGAARRLDQRRHGEDNLRIE
jgi:hypothetical protein